MSMETPGGFDKALFQEACVKARRMITEELLDPTAAFGRPTEIRERLLEEVCDGDEVLLEAVLSRQLRETAVFGGVERPRFAVGPAVRIELEAHRLIDAAGVDLEQLLDRHSRGDWGDVMGEEAADNERQLEDGAPVVSAYVLDHSVEPREGTVWVTTEPSRALTTVSTAIPRGWVWAST